MNKFALKSRAQQAKLSHSKNARDNDYEANDNQTKNDIGHG